MSFMGGRSPANPQIGRNSVTVRFADPRNQFDFWRVSDSVWIIVMREAFAALVLTIFVTGIAGAQEKDSEYVRLVTSGEIRKVDQKNKTFQFKITLDRPSRGGYNRPGGNPGGRGPGRGGGRRGGGGRFPAPFPNAATQPDSIEVKVFVSPSTVVRGDQTEFNFSNLKAGDHVSVTGIRRGSGNDIDAVEIQR